jgi:hypothetical protein
MFGLFKSTSSSDPTKAFAGMSDTAWLDLLISSIRGPSLRGVMLPGFPHEEVQRQFVGSAGKHSLQEGFSFFRVVKAYAESCGAPLTISTRVLDFGCASRAACYVASRATRRPRTCTAWTSTRRPAGALMPTPPGALKS